MNIKKNNSFYENMYVLKGVEIQYALANYNYMYIMISLDIKVSKGAKIRNRYNQVPHLTQDTNGKVTNSKTPQTRAKRSALSQQVTTKHILRPVKYPTGGLKPAQRTCLLKEILQSENHRLKDGAPELGPFHFGYH